MGAASHLLEFSDRWWVALYYNISPGGLVPKLLAFNIGVEISGSCSRSARS